MRGMWLYLSSIMPSMAGQSVLRILYVAANMFLVPYGMKLGSGVTVRDYIVRSMVPVTLGNIIPGVFFVAGGYALVYGRILLASCGLHFSQALDRTPLKRTNINRTSPLRGKCPGCS